MDRHGLPGLLRDGILRCETGNGQQGPKIQNRLDCTGQSHVCAVHTSSVVPGRVTIFISMRDVREKDKS